MNINFLILTGPIIVACQWNTEKERDLLQFGEAQVMIYFLPDKAAQKRKVYFKNKAFGKAAGKRAKELKRDRAKHSILCRPHSRAAVPHMCPAKKSHYTKNPQSSRLLSRLKIVSLNLVISNESAAMTALFEPATAKVQHELTHTCSPTQTCDT